MTADHDLDVGHDAGLETYPRHQVALLAAAPWIYSPPGLSPLTYLVLSLPLAWVALSWLSSRRAGAPR
jgi:hypothetical protein